MSWTNHINIFLVLSIYIPTCHCITKSITLTPDDPSLITLLKGATNYAPFEWDLYGVDEIGFNMKVHLNKSWCFHHKYATKLTLEIGSDTVTDTTSSNSLIVSFSQNNAKYLTSIIQISGDDDHYIYPPSNGAKQTFGEGNIEELVSEYKGSRIDKATNNGSYGYFEAMKTHPNISYPLQFIIENHPDFDYMIFSYSNPVSKPRNMVYFAMDPNVSLDIYLSAGDAGDNFDITYLNIIHTISETETETETPIYTTKTVKTVVKDSVNWFEKALVIILVSTVGILCCLLCVFGVMFTVLLTNHHKAAVKTFINSNLNRKEETKGLNIIHPPHIHHRGSSIKSSTATTMSTCSPPSNPRLSPSAFSSSNGHGIRITIPPPRKTKAKAVSSHAHPTPALCDVLAVLAPKLSRGSSTNRSQRSSMGTPQGQRDVNIVYNDLRDRRSTINTNGEMDSDDHDHLSHDIDHDIEIEAMYAPPSKEDIRRATMHSNDTTPGRGFGDMLPLDNLELHVDDGVNRVSIVNLDDILPNLAISVRNMESSDSNSSGLYEDTGNDEGTPFGSTDTQTDYAAISPYVSGSRERVTSIV